jgi:hypothetical protein
VLDVCAVLVKHVQKDGIEWKDLRRWEGREEGIDCVCNGPEGPIRMQVTRAIRDPEFFQTLGEHNAVQAYTSHRELTESLWATIEHKASRTPLADRSSIVLVLDAFDVFFGTDSPAVRHFAETHGANAASLGFKQVWLVGPHGVFVDRLA